jgi:hypothetical protein
MAVGFSGSLIAQMPGGGGATALSPLQTPIYIPIYAVRTADDDGTHAATVTAAKVQQLVANANPLFAPAGIQFTFDPAQDFPPITNNTLLNQDCTLLAPLPRGETVKRATVPVCDDVPNANARDAYAVQHNSHVVVFFRWGTIVNWNEGTGAWELLPATQGASSSCGVRVRLTAGGGSGTFLAHELGHYFHCAHTFGPQPETLAEATTVLQKYIAAYAPEPNQAARAFDGDGLDDTPPDPGPDLFVDVYGNQCAIDGVSVPINYPYLAILNPDRTNVMSYFNCPGTKHFSPQQIDRIRAAVLSGNRAHFRGAQRHAHAREPFNTTWAANSTVVAPFTLNGRAHMLVYGADGTARIEKIGEADKSMTTLWSGPWDTNAAVASFQFDNMPHFLRYTSSSGALSVVKVNATGQGVTTVWIGTWSLFAGYTHLVSFVQDGVPHVLFYSKSDGRLAILKFSAGVLSQAGSELIDPGYASVAAFEQNGQPQVLFYNKTTGAVKVMTIDAAALGVTTLFATTWETGYEAVSILRRGSVEPHAFVNKGAAVAKIFKINSDGFGPADVLPNWQMPHTSAAPFHMLTPSILFYNSITGVARIVWFCL